MFLTSRLDQATNNEMYWYSCHSHTRMFIHRPRQRRSERKDHRKQVTQTNSTTTQQTIAKLGTSAIHLYSEKTNVLRSLAL